MATTSKRLQEALDIRGMAQAELCRKTNIGKSSISSYLKGIYIPKQQNIYKMALALNVSEGWLLGLDCPMERGSTQTTQAEIPPAWERYPDSGIMPPPNMVKKPLIGTIVCGTPILAVENILGVYDVPDHIKCDFILQCTGDSMIGAHIANGSYVYIREQSMVEQGEIGAVLIDGEATLKRVYYDKSNNILTLNEENPKSPPLVYVGETLENIKIIGKAVGYTTWLE